MIKYLVLSALAAEYVQFLNEEFVDVMRLRGHKVEIVGDEILVDCV